MSSYVCGFLTMIAVFFHKSSTTAIIFLALVSLELKIRSRMKLYFYISAVMAQLKQLLRVRVLQLTAKDSRSFYVLLL